mgnify:CR=1 FL=1
MNFTFMEKEISGSASDASQQICRIGLLILPNVQNNDQRPKMVINLHSKTVVRIYILLLLAHIFVNGQLVDGIMISMSQFRFKLDYVNHDPNY